VLTRAGIHREVLDRTKFHCRDTQRIYDYFASLGEFEVVVEATAAYEWFFLPIEKLASRMLLAHPKKMRVIAESCRKTDKIDAFVLAEFLSLDMIPAAWRPSPRQRQHRVLVRFRKHLQGRITSIKNKLRNKLAHYNADIASSFTEAGDRHMAEVAVSAADRFELDRLRDQLQTFREQLGETDRKLAEFARGGPQREREVRAVLDTIPQIGPVTIDAVVSELGDFRRFRSAKDAVAYAGLAPGFRESAGKRKNLHISKEGSRILRWALVEAAWRLVIKSARWENDFQRLSKNTGSRKKAICGIARKLLCVMFAMAGEGSAYREAKTPCVAAGRKVPTPGAADAFTPSGITNKGRCGLPPPTRISLPKP